MVKQKKKYDIVISDNGMVGVKINAQLNYNEVFELMGCLKKAQVAAAELLKLSRKKELLKTNFK
jgi:hypothetical protein